MRAMFHLFASMPLFVIVNLALLVRGRQEHLTEIEITNRLRAIETLVDLLPVASTPFESAALNNVLTWCGKEIEALTVLARLRIVVSGTVPCFHDPRITQEN